MIYLATKWVQFCSPDGPFPFRHKFYYSNPAVICGFVRKFHKQTISFKLCVLSVMKLHTIMLHATQDVNHLCLASLHDRHHLPIGHLKAVSVIRSTVEISQCLFK